MKYRPVSYLLALVVFVSACAPQPTAPLVIDDQNPDGLQRVSTKYFNVGFVRPGVDFSRYDGVLITESELAFRTPDRSKNEFPLSDEQKLRFRDLLDRQFTHELAALQNLRLTETAGPAVLDLHVRVQDILATVPPRAAGRSGWGSLYLEALGEATLVIELRDSESDEILARVYDRRALEGSAVAQKGAPPVTRWEQAEAVCKRWANTVRQRLDALVISEY